MKLKFLIILTFISMSLFSQNNGVQVGSKLPSFEAIDQNSKPIVSSDLIGKSYLILYFYPKDFTAGCTKEACTFRDNYSDFEDLNISIYGVSADSPERHLEFIKEYNLQFSLIADEENKLRKQFDVPNDMFGLIPGRVTYIFDLDGKCIYLFDSQTSPSKHITESLKAIKALQ